MKSKKKIHNFIYTHRLTEIDESMLKSLLKVINNLTVRQGRKIMDRLRNQNKFIRPNNPIKKLLRKKTVLRMFSCFVRDGKCFIVNDNPLFFGDSRKNSLKNFILLLVLRR